MAKYQPGPAKGSASLWFGILAAIVLAHVPARALTGAGAAPAAENPTSGWVDKGDVKIRLIAAQDSVGEGAALLLGLHLRLKPGWKTYWRQPGEAGLPPELDWAGSDNLAGVEMFWPLPRWFSADGLNSIGYKDDVVFPLWLRPAATGRALGLKLKVDFAVCLDICLPQEAELRLTVPAGPAVPSVFATLIERYRGWVPVPAAEARGLRFGAPVISGPAGALTLELEVRAQEPLKAAELFIEGPPALAFGRPSLARYDAGRRIVFEATVTGGGAARDMVATPLRFTLGDGRRGVDYRATPVVRP